MIEPEARTTERSLPITEVLTSLLRWSPLIVILTVSVAAGVFLLAEDEEVGAAATARVGLTDEVGWPLYDAARDRVAGLVTDGPVRERVEADLPRPHELVELRVDIPPSQGYIEVTAEAATVDTALTAVAAAVADMIEIEELRLSAGFDAELAVLEGQLAEIGDDIAELDAAMPGLVQAEAEARERSSNADGDDAVVFRAQYTEASAALAIAEELRSQEAWRLAGAQRAIDELLRDAGPGASTIEMSRAPAPVDSSRRDSAMPAVLAGATALVLTSLLALSADRVFGRIRNPARAASAVARPVFDLATPAGGQRLLLAAAAPVAGGGHPTVGIASVAFPADPALVSEIGRVLGCEPLALGGALEADDLVSAVQRLGAALSNGGVLDLGMIEDDESPLLAAGQLVTRGFVIVNARMRLQRLHKTVRRFDDHGIAVAGVVLASPDATWKLPSRSLVEPGPAGP